MPKQLINIIGIIVCAGILMLALVVVALPIYFQSLATGAQTATVDQSNDLYQAQVDALRVEAERMAEIEASLEELGAQIPATNELDEVFELVARSADAANVQVMTITAGDNVEFVARTQPLAAGEEPSVPAPEEPASGSENGESTDEATNAADPNAVPAEETPAAEGEPSDGPQQVDFTINVSATRLSDAITFLDRLRDGPRLVSSIQSTVIPTGTGFDVSVTALTYVLPEA